MTTRLSSALLYAPGAFFFYPWKPLALLSAGDTYAAAYSHFRRDHSDPTNLILHAVALCWQLAGNFGLLAALDRLLVGDELWPSGPLSALSALSWAGTLVLSPAPSICSLASVAGIATAYAIAPLLSPNAVEIVPMACFIVVVCVASVVLTPSTTVTDGRRGTATSRLARNLGRTLVYFGIAVAARGAGSRWHGQFSAWAPVVNACLLLLMSLLAMLPKPVVPCVLGGVIVVRVLAELTAQNLLLLYSNAFLAQLSQGIAHDISQQKATLLSLEDSIEDMRVRLAFDWAHCVYFPNLLFHSCYQSLVP